MLKFIQNLSKSRSNNYANIANNFSQNSTNINDTKVSKLPLTHAIALKVADIACIKVVQWLDKAEQAQTERLRADIDIIDTSTYK